MERPGGSNSRDNGGNVYQRMFNSQQNSVIPGLVCLMVAIALERITFYIVTGNMTNFFVKVVKVNESDVDVTAYLVFSGSSYFFPLLGGMLGDLMISRYVCTLIGFLIEAVGSIFLLVLSIIIDDTTKLTTRELEYGMVSAGLTLMAIGQGFHRTNILALGCKQLGKQTDQTKNLKAVEKFFRGYYWVTNVGALIAQIILSVTEISQKESKQEPVYYLQYLAIVQTVTVFLGAFFIIVGKRWFIRTTPNVENLRKLSRSFFRKIRFMCRCFRQNRANFSLSSQLSERKDEDEVSTHVFKNLLVTSGLIMFGIIYFLETGDIFFNQGKKMDYTIKNETIPLQLLLGFEAFTIVLVLPVIHFLITPFLAIPLLKQMGLGLLFGLASALTCGIVEAVRVNQSCSQPCFSIFLQVPQFVFLSLAEIFARIANFVFSYCESPPDMEGLFLGMAFCLFGFGSYMARIIVLIVDAVQESWYPSDFDEGEVWKFLFLLAGLQLLFFFIFAWYAYHYPYKYLYKETEESSVRSPLLRGAVQSEMYDTFTSIESASVNSIDSSAASES
ncbi:uncharacterized protein LOC135494516 isoform X3 [Lineus longissimus]